MDMISNLPLGVIETILCLLPIKVAARTSILSKEWKYHWTKISKISFTVDTFQGSTDGAHELISSLAMHKGPILELALSIDADVSTAGLDCILFLLSKKNTVKKLTLEVIGRVPSDVYSLHQLTDLHLVRCHLMHQPTFNGFGSLTSLSIQKSLFTKRTLMHLLSNSPLLKSVDITFSRILDGDDSTMINLFECFSMIENLSICFWIIECFPEMGLPEELPTTLVHLKSLSISDISLIHKYGLPSIAFLIRSSPNLEKLKIQILDDSWFGIYERSDSVTLEDFLDIWLEHLNELVITYMIYKKTQLDFVKLILSKSPVLKKVRIFLRVDVEKDEELEISRILLCSQWASPLVQITVSRESVNCS